MIPLTYQEHYSKKSFHDLIRVFGEWVSDSELKLNKLAGDGSIYAMDVEDGLQVRIWDCTLNTDFTIMRQKSTGTENKTFTIVYYLTPGSFEMLPDAGRTINSLWNTVFMSSDAEFNVRILSGRPMKCLSLNFTPAWLEKHILNGGVISDCFFRQLSEPDPVVLFESLSQNEIHVIGNLFQNKDHASFGKFFYRSKVLNLLTEFFEKVKGRSTPAPGSQNYHEEQIADAEKMLMDHIRESLPDLKLMAQKLSMSESTLKRYFRKQYGKNIYTYFLEKKMIYARKLLQEGKSTVTETAYMLGYEKASHFIHMFQRFYGTRPGVFKQSNSLSGSL